jgi:hypothetical protein
VCGAETHAPLCTQSGAETHAPSCIHSMYKQRGVRLTEHPQVCLVNRGFL